MPLLPMFAAVEEAISFLPGAAGAKGVDRCSGSSLSAPMPPPACLPARSAREGMPAGLVSAGAVPRRMEAVGAAMSAAVADDAGVLVAAGDSGRTVVIWER